MDEPRSHVRAAVRPVDVVDDRVEQRSVLLNVRRVNEHSRRLVYDEQVGVFLDDVERNVLSEHRVLSRKVDGDLDKVVWKQSLTDVFVTAVHLAITGLYNFAKVHLAKLWKASTKKIDKPNPPLVLAHNDLQPFNCHNSVVFPRVTAVSFGLSRPCRILQICTPRC